MNGMKYTAEEVTCPIVGAADNYHFRMFCEDCDVQQLAKSSLGRVEDLYHTGWLTQDEFEAYQYVWATLSPSGSRPEWRAVPEYPVARRIARKLLRAHGAEIPAVLVEPIEVSV